MSDYLVFRLYAPLASWGTAAVGEERPTATYPGRAAIVGLLAAALGIRRHESQRLTELNANLAIAVKQYCAGRLLRDYHTVQTPPTRRGRHFYTRRDELNRPANELSTIISRRDYRSDGLWIVAIQATAAAPADLLRDLAAALENPRFTLYLGRRACPPAAPLAPQCIRVDNWRAALDHEFPPLADAWGNPLIRARDVLYSWEESAAALDGNTSGVESSEVWDVPGDRDRWQFAQRREFRRYARAEGDR